MLFDSILSSVDGTIANYVQAAHGAFAMSLAWALRLLIILYIVWYGISLQLQMAALSISEVVGRVIVIALISILVSRWDWFVLFFYDFFVKAPSSVGLVLVHISDPNAAPTTLNKALGTIFDIGISAGSKLREQGGLTNLGPLFYALIIYIATVLMTGFALFLLILSRLAVAILLAVAPVFLLLAFFKSSRSYFEGWFRVLTNYALISVFVYALIAILLAAFHSAVVALNSASENEALSLTQIAPFTLIAVISTLLFTQVPNIAAGITGGFSLQTMGAFGGAVGRALGLSRSSVGLALQMPNRFRSTRFTRAADQLGAALRNRGYIRRGGAGTSQPADTPTGAASNPGGRS